ncbi:hypothetical protein Tco_0368527 [Tanacetum coccineum]
MYSTTQWLNFPNWDNQQKRFELGKGNRSIVILRSSTSSLFNTCGIDQSSARNKSSLLPKRIHYPQRGYEMEGEEKESSKCLDLARILQDQIQHQLNQFDELNGCLPALIINSITLSKQFFISRAKSTGLEKCIKFSFGSHPRENDRPPLGPLGCKAIHDHWLREVDGLWKIAGFEVGSKR